MQSVIKWFRRKLVLIQFLLLLLAAMSSCSIDSRSAIDEQVVGDCNDTSGFKSLVDLQLLTYLENCNVGSANKTVPGLGSVYWNCNCSSILYGDTVLILSFEAYQTDGFVLAPWEVISIGYVKPQKGAYVVKSKPVEFNETSGFCARLLSDGDVLDGAWEMDSICSSTFEITRIDLGDKEVEGKFDLHFRMVRQGHAGYLYSERIQYENGHFKARIQPFE